MKKRELEKFGLEAIRSVLSRSDINEAREALAFAIGATVDVTGKVMTRVKRNNQCKLFLQPTEATTNNIISGGNKPLSVVADCKADEPRLISRKVRKGSFVKLRGKLQSFGYQIVILSDCRLIE